MKIFTYVFLTHLLADHIYRQDYGAVTPHYTKQSKFTNSNILLDPTLIIFKKMLTIFSPPSGNYICHVENTVHTILFSCAVQEYHSIGKFLHNKRLPKSK